jgi:hypothetical protein
MKIAHGAPKGQVRVPLSGRPALIERRQKRRQPDRSMPDLAAALFIRLKLPKGCVNFSIASANWGKTLTQSLCWD